MDHLLQILPYLSALSKLSLLHIPLYWLAKLHTIYHCQNVKGQNIWVSVLALVIQLWTCHFSSISFNFCILKSVEVSYSIQSIGLQLGLATETLGFKFKLLVKSVRRLELQFPSPLGERVVVGVKIAIRRPDTWKLLWFNAFFLSSRCHLYGVSS